MFISESRNDKINPRITMIHNRSVVLIIVRHSVLGLLYGPVDSFYFLASDIESAMDWCEEQCRVNKILQAVHQSGKGESEHAECCVYIYNPLLVSSIVHKNVSEI